MLKAGDTWTLRSGGGGGFGSPIERDVERVSSDVINGYVSAQSARAHYGVIIDKKTGQAERGATSELRIQMKAQGLPADQPYSSPARLLEALQNPGKSQRRIKLTTSRKRSPDAQAWHEEACAEGLLVDRCCS